MHEHVGLPFSIWLRKTSDLHLEAGGRKSRGVRALIAVLLLTAVAQLLAQDITFTNKTVTFTNLEGRVFKDVLLVKGDADGLIWRADASGGRVSYTNMAPEILQRLGVPTNRIEMALARAGQRQKAMEAQQQQQAAVAAQAAKMSRWQELKIISIDFYTWSRYKCAVAPINLGDKPVPSYILVDRLPDSLTAIPNQIRDEQAKLKQLSEQIQIYAKAIANKQRAVDAADAVTPVGASGDAGYVDAVMAQRQQVNLAQLDVNQAMERLSAMKDEQQQHIENVISLQRKFDQTTLRLFFTGYMVNGLEIWTYANR